MIQARRRSGAIDQSNKSARSERRPRSNRNEGIQNAGRQTMTGQDRSRQDKTGQDEKLNQDEGEDEVVLVVHTSTHARWRRR